MAPVESTTEPYVENEDHVPAATDMRSQFNTSGLGADSRIEEVSQIFETDKVKVAEDIKAALDPDDTTVPRDRVVFPNAQRLLATTQEEEQDELLARADAVLATKKERLNPSLSPAQVEAAREGDDGERAAVAQEKANADAQSTGTGDGTHDDSTGGPHSQGDQSPANTPSTQSQGSSVDDRSTGSAKKSAQSSQRKS